MMNPNFEKITDPKTPDSGWKRLYTVGGSAALIAGLLFRRNIAAEIGLFSGQQQPANVNEWFALLQNNRLLALSFLNIFDVVNYTLVGLMYIALYVVLKRVNKSYMTIAAALSFLGIGVYFASNTALSMLSLSDQYAAAGTDTRRSILLAAGEALLAINRFSSPGAHPGTGGYISLALIAIAGMITSVVMLRSDIFKTGTAYLGILASGFDLAYCIAFVFVPAVDGDLLAIIFIPAAGLFLMIWHIMIGWRLYQLGRKTPGS